MAVNFGHPKKNTISIEIHHGNRKNVATLRTVRSIIQNMVIGVTKGFKYKMRYVYAHFPINVNLDQSKETGLWEVEIRNFIGEKIVRRVVMQEGVDVELSKNQKDELVLSGNSLERVSQSAADIQQICKVRNKDIRKVRFFPTKLSFVFDSDNSPENMTRDGRRWGWGGNLCYSHLLIQQNANVPRSSWTVCTFPRRVTLLRTKEGKMVIGHRTYCFFCVSGSLEWRRLNHLHVT